MADVNVKINVIAAGASRTLTDVARSAGNASNQFSALNLALKQGTSTFKIFAGNLAAAGVARAFSAISSSIVDFGKSVSDNTIELERISTQFETLTGSVKTADTIIRQLQAFTARTPFQFEGVAAAAQRLISFGFEVDEIETQLEGLGNVAAASGADLGELSLIFGQIAAAGRLTGERLLQLQERAIPIGPALAETLGVAESSIRDLVSRGQVDFATFERAFQSLSREGSFAFGGIERASQTLGGRISTLKDNFIILQQTLGQQIQPALRAIVTTTTSVIQSITNTAQSFASLSDGGSLIIGVLTSLIKISAFVVQTFQALQGIFVGLASGATELFTNVLRAAEGLVNFARVAASVSGIEFEGLARASRDLEELRKTGEAAAQGLANDADDIFTSLTETGNKADEIANKLEQNFAKEQNASKERANSILQDNQAIIDSSSAKTDAVTALSEKELRAQIEANQQKLAADDAFFLAQEEARAARDGIVTEREALELQKLADLRQSAREEQLIREREAAGLLDNIETLKTQTAADQQKRRTALILEEERVRQQERQQSLRQTADLFGGLAQLAATGGEKVFRVTQALQLAQATVAGIAAVQQAASAAPFPANLPGIITETARAAASVIQIKSAAPRFQDGGIVPGNSISGDRVFARVNSGEMILNRQQQAQLFSLAQGRGAAGSQEIVVNTRVELDGEVVGRSVSRQVANGLQLGENI